MRPCRNSTTHWVQSEIGKVRVRGDVTGVWMDTKTYSNWHNIAPYFGSQNDLAWPSEAGLCHFATSDHLLDGEFEIASDLDGRLHCDHGAWLGFNVVALLKCEMEN